MTRNETAYECAQRLIEAGRVALDLGGDWSEHQASADDENRSIADESTVDEGAGR